MPSEGKIRRIGLLYSFLTAGVAYVSGAAFTFFCLDVSKELVHSLGHSHQRLTWVGRAMDDGSPIPMLVSTGIAAYGLLCLILRSRERRETKALAQTPGGDLLVAGASAGLLALALVWAAEGRHMAGYYSAEQYDFYAWFSGILAVGLVWAIALGLAAEFTVRGAKWAALVPPIAVVAVLTLSLLWHGEEEEFGVLPPAWVAPALQLPAMGLVLIAGILIAISARRSGRSPDCALQATASFLWVIALLALLPPLFRRHHMCIKIAHEPMQDAASILVGVVFTLAVGARILVHLRRRRVIHGSQVGGVKSA